MALACFLRLFVSVCVLSTGVTAIPALVAVPAHTTSSYLLRIVVKSEQSVFRPGTTAHVTCEGPPIGPNDRVELLGPRGKLHSVHVGYGDFLLTNLTESDTGIYTCAIHFYDGSWTSTVNFVYIEVQSYADYRNTTMGPPAEDPPTLYLHQPLALFYEGESITLTCMAPGYGPWEHYELTKDGRVVAQQEGDEFSIYNLQADDSGSYSCAVLLVYRKLHAHNHVLIEVAPYSGADGDGDYHSSGMGQSCYPALVTSVVLWVIVRMTRRVQLHQ